MESIAQRLILLREKYHFSKSDIARQIDVTPALISAYENQERKPSIDKLVALADIFHVSADYILGRNVEIDNTITISLEGLSDRQIKLIRELVSEFQGENLVKSAKQTKKN